MNYLAVTLSKCLKNTYILRLFEIGTCVFRVLEPSPTLRVDRHSAEHFGWQNDASAVELAFYYKCTRQRGDYTGDSERFFFKLEAGSSEQTPATSAAAAKLQDLTQ